METKLNMTGSVSGKILNEKGEVIREISNNNSMTYLIEKLMVRNLVFDNPTNDGDTEMVYGEATDEYFTKAAHQVTKIFFSDTLFTAQSLSTNQTYFLNNITSESTILKTLEPTEVIDLGSDSDIIKRYGVKLSFELTNDYPMSFSLKSMGLLSAADEVLSVLNFEDAVLLPGERLDGNYVITLTIKRT